MSTPTISQRLVVLASVATGALVLVVLLGWLAASALDDALGEAFEKTLPSVKALSDAEADTLRIMLGVRSLISASFNDMDGEIRKTEEAKSPLAARFNEYEKWALNDEDRMLLQADKARAEALFATLPPIIEKARAVERIAQMAEECTAAASGSADSARQLDALAGSMQRFVGSYRL
ncbi:MCP four helix bundle domain-containing protein [Viridibacterium curvum]|uniref:Chemotaxis methyl-accepting receptor HlyB-like 4HB MCP domain-containing protein n=1 Tax=Viridibacterium curvum TaxID=1101404 RepID=A0ABP9QN86_9RHOO